MLDYKEIERSIIKTYRKDIWGKFIKAISTYQLLKPNDKVAVAISGGKDSLLLAKLFQELKRHSKFPFELEFITMDPGFSKENINQLIENCAKLNIPVQIKKSDVFQVASLLGRDQPCYMCARMRRGFLYNFAQELGCNKLALGHHFDDVIETTLLNVFYAGNFKTMVPKVAAKNFSNMELIRPMFYIKEKDIKRFAKASLINTMDCGCEVASGKFPSKRKEIKELIATLQKTFPDVDISIFRSAENINLEAVLGYKQGEIEYHFNDIYEGID